MPDKQKQARPRSPGNRPDWEAIRRDYRIGALTQRELAEKHQVREETLCRRIKSDQARDPALWVRDLRNEVQAAASAMLVQEAVKAASSEHQGEAVSGVLAAAEVIKGVISGHRKDAQKAQKLAADLLAELADLPARMDDLRAAIEACTEPGEAGDAKRRELEADLREAARLHARIGSAQKLADTMVKLQAVERRAYSIPDDGPTPGDDLDTMSDAELDARIAGLLAKRG